MLCRTSFPERLRSLLPELGDEPKGRNLLLGFFKFSDGRSDGELKLLAARRVTSSGGIGGRERGACRAALLPVDGQKPRALFL